MSISNDFSLRHRGSPASKTEQYGLAQDDQKATEQSKSLLAPAREERQTPNNQRIGFKARFLKGFQRLGAWSKTFMT